MAVSSTYPLPTALAEYCEASTIALTIAAADREDVPLVLANTAFLNLVGYSAEEVLDTNCRFLQGAESSAEARASITAFIQDDTIEAERFRITNHRKDGSVFENFLFMSRLRDPSGKNQLILGAQFDLTHASRRSEVETYNAELQKNISDINSVSKGFGLAMIDSAEMISRSISMLAGLALLEG